MASNGNGIKATIEGDELVIRMPIGTPTRSASGKTMVVASTRGNICPDGCVYDGHQVTLGVNAYFKP